MSSFSFSGGVWTSYTPTVTSSGGAINTYTINSAQYMAIGKQLTIQLDITITDAGTGSGAIFVTLPSGIFVGNNRGSFFGKEITNTGKGVIGYVTSSVIVLTYSADNSTAIATNSRVVGIGVGAIT